MEEETAKAVGKVWRRNPSSRRYLSTNRRAQNKNRRVLKSSHGKWTYKALLEHQRELDKPQKRTT